MNTKIIFGSLLFSSFLLLYGCNGSKEQDCGQAIADYIQTDRRGTWTDLQFKVISLETSNCTANDSIRLLTEAFEAKKAKSITHEKELLEYWQKRLEENKQEKFAKGFFEDMYTKYITQTEHRLDSIENLKPEIPSSLSSPNPGKVVAIEARCRYSIVLPGYGTRQEKTEVFVLTPDRKKVTSKKRLKN